MRTIQVPPDVAIYLRRIQELDPELKKISFNDLLKAGVDQYVFRVNGIDKTSDFGRMFKRLLKDAALLVDKRSGREKTLYCLRHYYATLMITKGEVTTAQLADYMGTSEQMIQEHYKHLNLQDLAVKFAGVGNLEEVLVQVNKPKRLAIPKSTSTP
jgi:integrase